MPKKVKLITQLAIIFFCFLYYGTTLNNNYSLDDIYVIEDNTRVQQGISGIPNLFKTHYIVNDTQSYGYRPVTLTVFAIEYEFFGANPTISHLINVILYIVTCLLLLHILTHLFREQHWLLPILTVALFLIHPIHTEVVNNIKSRDELLAFLFALLALWNAINWARKKYWFYLPLCFLLLALSLLSKMSTLTFLAIIPFTLYFFEGVSLKKIGLVVVSLLAVFIFYKLGSNQLIDEQTKTRELLFIETPLFTNQTSFLDRIPMAFFSVGYYLKLLIYPFPLLFYYGYNHVPIAGWGSVWAWLSFFICLGAMLYVVLQWKRKHVLIYGLVYFFIAISMYANLVKPAVGIIAERFVYIPSLGFCVVLAYVILKGIGVLQTLNKPTKKQRVYTSAIVVLLIVFTLPLVLQRNMHWKTKFTLVENDIKYLKNSAKANELLGDYHSLLKDKEPPGIKRNAITEKAIQSYANALAVYPDNGNVYNNLGVLYQEKGQIDKAIIYYRKSHEYGFVKANSFFNLAMAYFQKKEYDNAIAYFERSIATNAKYINSYDQLINLYFVLEQYDEALEVNIRALMHFPERRELIIKSGQQIAETLYGKGTDFYINLLKDRGVIDQSLFESFKETLDKNQN